MKPEIVVILCIFLGFVVPEMVFTQFFRKPGQTRQDAWVELISTSSLMFVTRPFVWFAGGDLLFLRDVLFGTARMTRRYPERMGVENLGDAILGQQLFWPLVPMPVGSKKPAGAQPGPAE